MEPSTLSPAEFLQHLRAKSTPLTLSKDGGAPSWDDRALHQAFYASDPALYALMALLPTVNWEQRTRILLQILCASRAGLPIPTRHVLDRVVRLMLCALPADRVLTVFLALRRLRANHKHTTQAIAGYLLNHPEAAALLVCRRPAVVDCLEHALGRNTARGCVKSLTRAETIGRTRPQVLSRFARQPAVASALMPTLYSPPIGIGGSGIPCDGAYLLAHQGYAERVTPPWERAATITATNRGDISAILMHLYRGGASPPVQEALERSVNEAVADLPRFSGRLVLVLDASASMRGYGDREFCCLSQSVALQYVLARVCPDQRIYTVGGHGDPPQAQGETDLAGALLTALECDPDLVAIVSDGYENMIAGDLEQMVAALPGAGITTPVVFCHSKFTNQDDLTLRRPAPGIPQLEFWHQRDFAPLLVELFTQARGAQGTECLRDYLVHRLDRLETECELWTARH